MPSPSSHLAPAQGLAKRIYWALGLDSFVRILPILIYFLFYFISFKLLSTVMIKTIGASPIFHLLSKFSKPRVDNSLFEVYLHNHTTLDHFNELMY